MTEGTAGGTAARLLQASWSCRSVPPEKRGRYGKYRRALLSCARIIRELLGTQHPHGMQEVGDPAWLHQSNQGVVRRLSVAIRARPHRLEAQDIALSRR